MKKNSKIWILILIICLIFITGCKSETEIEEGKLSTITCSREATIESDSSAKASLTYKIYYSGDFIKILNSIEKVTSSNSDTLDSYESAYRSIIKNYEGLKYYDNKITRDDNSVISDTTINYGKIDTDKLLEIEGSEDNVIVNGKVKVDNWKSFAKKFGVTCNN